MTTALDLFDTLRRAKRLDTHVEIRVTTSGGMTYEAWASAICCNDASVDILSFVDRDDGWRPRMTVIKAIMNVADFLVHRTVEPDAPVTVDLCDGDISLTGVTYDVTAAWETVDGIIIECREPSKDL